jgi:hypothetical protein
MIRKISAHYVYSGETLCKYGIVVFDNNGVIIDTMMHGKIEESEKLEFFDGLITPGFVSVDTSILGADSILLHFEDVNSNIGEVKGIFKNIILEDPVYIGDELKAQLLFLERQGANIILHFASKDSGDQKAFFARIKDILKRSSVDLLDVLKWTTLNPARLKGMDSNLGIIQVNKKPGLNSISGLDYRNMKLSESSSIRVIV